MQTRLSLVFRTEQKEVEYKSNPRHSLLRTQDLLLVAARESPTSTNISKQCNVARKQKKPSLYAQKHDSFPSQPKRFSLPDISHFVYPKPMR